MSSEPEANRNISLTEQSWGDIFTIFTGKIPSEKLHEQQLSNSRLSTPVVLQVNGMAKEWAGL